jgi:hypothetical protein
MPQYTIELTEAEDKALSVVSISQLEWITNAVKSRCALAMDEIVQQEVNRKLEAGEPITGTKDEIVLGANVKTCAERNAEFEAQIAEMAAQSAQQGA